MHILIIKCPLPFHKPSARRLRQSGVAREQVEACASGVNDMCCDALERLGLPRRSEYLEELGARAPKMLGGTTHVIVQDEQMECANKTPRQALCALGASRRALSPLQAMLHNSAFSFVLMPCQFVAFGKVIDIASECERYLSKGPLKKPGAIIMSITFPPNFLNTNHAPRYLLIPVSIQLIELKCGVNKCIRPAVFSLLLP